jgi:uncharacterized membrane protein
MAGVSPDLSYRMGRAVLDEVGTRGDKAAVRLISVDMARGLAIAGVVIFHIVWDLDFTRIIPPGIASHPSWILFGRMLAGSFMVLVGVSLALAHRNAIHVAPFAKRLLVIASAALAISVASRFVFPERFIYFGILHAIAVASVVGLLFRRLPAIVLAATGGFIIAFPFLVTSPLFDTRWLAWIGFSAQPPPSNDYVPVFPWLGLTLLGLAIAKAAIEASVDQWLHRHEPDSPVASRIAWMGRHSLAIYLIHQPVLLGLLIPLATWWG